MEVDKCYVCGKEAKLTASWVAGKEIKTFYWCGKCPVRIPKADIEETFASKVKIESFKLYKK